MQDDKDIANIDIARYFRANLLTCRQAIDPMDFKKFMALKTNGERVAFVLSYPEAHCLPLEVEDYQLKDMTKALRLKETGNKYFGRGIFFKALESYSSAIIITPRKELGIFLGNRSAALYNLEYYHLAIIDIKEALNIGYPQELYYKLEERRAKCYLALGNGIKSSDAFKKTLQYLDFAKIPIDKKKKIESDIRIMLAIMEKGGNHKLKGKSERKNECIIPKIKECNKLYPACSSAMEICDAGGDIGRHAIATRDIVPGELLVVERPHSTTLLGEYRLKNCHYCFKKNVAPYPAACNTCTLIAYCSPSCRNADAKTHLNECTILGPLWLSNASITCLMAIKAVIQTPWNRLVQLKNDYEFAKQNYKPTEKRPFISSDFVSYWSLVTHEATRTQDDLFHRAYMAAWLLRLLKTTNYLPEDVKTPDLFDHQLSSDELFIGDLLLHHLQLLQFNTHEVSELVRLRNEKSLAKSKNNFIGGGLYPTTALLNHSCNPGIVR
ncbi:hypothetical protein PV328_005718 [Microctonus aethiopoides]|nr:hypothetical protein PV328_005718 [Microctonus aethiopoides]